MTSEHIFQVVQLEVTSMDYGNSYPVKLNSIRILETSSTETMYLRECPPRFSNLVLADVVAHQQPESSFLQSEEAIVFIALYLKSDLENKVQKALPMEMYDDYVGVRMFHAYNDQLFATSMIEKGLGVPSIT